MVRRDLFYTSYPLEFKLLQCLMYMLSLFAGQHTSQPDASHSNTAPSQTTGFPSVIRGHPTPANLGAVIRRTMGLINGQAGLELDVRKRHTFALPFYHLFACLLSLLKAS